MPTTCSQSGGTKPSRATRTHGRRVTPARAACGPNARQSEGGSLAGAAAQCTRAADREAAGAGPTCAAPRGARCRAFGRAIESQDSWSRMACGPASRSNAAQLLVFWPHSLGANFPIRYGKSPLLAHGTDIRAHCQFGDRRAASQARQSPRGRDTPSAPRGRSRPDRP